MFSSIYSILQEIFIECLLCARHYSRYFGYSSEQNKQKSLSEVLGFIAGLSVDFRGSADTGHCKQTYFFVVHM